MKWNTFSGGTGSHPSKYSYQALTDIGSYHIDPAGPYRDSSYILHVTNELGKLAQSGLWRDLGKFRSPQAAKAEARKHYETAERYLPMKTNPAPYFGTAKPRRRSNITGRAPSRRLLARRAKNTRRGFFPNPQEVARAHRALSVGPAKTRPTHFHYRLTLLSRGGKGPVTLAGKWHSAESATDDAKALADMTGRRIQIERAY